MFPVLPFLVFLGKRQGKPTKKQQGFFLYPYPEPLKSLERRENPLKKTRNSLQGKKQGIPKRNKARKDRVLCFGLSQSETCEALNFSGKTKEHKD